MIVRDETSSCEDIRRSWEDKRRAEFGAGQAIDYLQDPNKMSMIVDPEIKNVKIDNLSVLCSVISLCIEPELSKRPSMHILCAMLEDGIDTSVGAIFREPSLAWAELVLSV